MPSNNTNSYINFNDLRSRNEAFNYLMYDNKSHINVLFLGSCRITGYMAYFNSLQLNPRPNIYGIFINIFT